MQVNSDDFWPSPARSAETSIAPTLLMVANIVSSTLYLAACIVSGLVLHNQGALIFGLIAAGVSYLATLLQMIAPPWRMSIFTLVAISIATGICAGVALLWW